MSARDERVARLNTRSGAASASERAYRLPTRWPKDPFRDVDE